MEMNRRKTDNLEKSRKMKLLTIFSYGTLILAFGFLGVIIYWLVYPYKTVDIFEYHLLQKSVIENDRLNYSFKYCVYTDKSAEVYRNLVDGVTVQLDFTSVQFPQTCGEGQNSVRIPDGTEPGIYHLRVVSIIQVNPIRKVTKEYISDNFKVIESEDVR